MTMPTRAEIHPVLLRTLAQWLGTPRPRDVIAKVTEAFPKLTDKDLASTNKGGESTWINRVHWARQDLLIRGLIDGSVKGVWQLTEQGRKEANQADEPKPIEPPVQVEEEPPELYEPQVLEVVSSDADALINELRNAAIDSANPARLERAVADALRFLDYEVNEIGGTGHTDVLALAPLGPLRYRVVLDAKSTSSKRVMEHQINWLGIDGHRKAEAADHACVVGSDFAGGALQQHAEDFDVSLMTTETLCELVQIHSELPLTLVELRSVFAAVPNASASMPEIRARAAARQGRMRLLLFLLQQIDHFNTAAPDCILVKAETLWAATLHLDEFRGIGQEDVSDALRLLEIIGAIAKPNGDGYVSQTSLSGAKSMLRAVSWIAQPKDDDQAGVPSRSSTSERLQA